MNGNYATHKRFVNDVVRYTDVDKISEASSYFILLRSCSAMKDIDDGSIEWVVNKIVNLDLTDIYTKLYNDGQGLTNQEIVFRIKRIKYLKREDDIYRFKFPQKITDIGNAIENTVNIRIMNVKLINPNKPKKDDITSNMSRKEKHDYYEKWIVENVRWKGRNGIKNEGKMSARTASMKINLSPPRIRKFLRDYYGSK